ncbi:MAG: NADH:ubiquinone reductase (Na(+)-transporting) subunit C [Muribaculaceae bacterium]|nr:NADH:ubiquinone reductase (Na(+)-transporting) subunit C [Muribaculaceae bacterium]MBR5435376.1 NADH:ubiquinone reductase (Na(+)-transporting) subunit C [Muribaculaceae bacterium]
MNKQSNTYTVIYIILLVAVVGTAMALTALALKPQQKANADADKMKQILASIKITQDKADILNAFDQYITDQYIVDSKGQKVENDIKAFDVNVAEESKKEAADRLLPVYESTVDGAKKFIIPVYGAGLWGPIWGYVAFNDDLNTVYGAYFSHQGETPGLGAEIAKPEFGAKFIGKQIFKDGEFKSIAVVKAGNKPLDDEDYIDGVSGGTITSKGVDSMLRNCLSAYQEFFKSKQ